MKIFSVFLRVCKGAGLVDAQFPLLLVLPALDLFSNVKLTVSRGKSGFGRLPLVVVLVAAASACGNGSLSYVDTGTSVSSAYATVTTTTTGTSTETNVTTATGTSTGLSTTSATTSTGTSVTTLTNTATDTVVVVVTDSVVLSSTDTVTVASIVTANPTVTVTSTTTATTTNTSLGTSVLTGLATGVTTGTSTGAASPTGTSTGTTTATSAIPGTDTVAEVVTVLDSETISIVTTSMVISTVGAPSGLTAVAGDSQVTLNWTPVAQAAAYNVYYATAPGITIKGPITAGPVSVTPVAGNAVVVKVITGLANGTPYYFVVTAVTSTGESVLSGEVSAVPNGHVITTIAGKIMTTGSANGAGLTAALFDYPAGIATDGTYLYVTDSGNNTIRKVLISSGEVSTIAGTAGRLGSNDGAALAVARFNNPAGITTDGPPPYPNLYVTDTGNSTIRKISNGQGLGCTVSFTATAAGALSATLAGITVAAGGSGYAVGDVLNVAGGTGTVTVGTVNPVNGAVLMLSAYSAGGGYAPGLGCTLNFTATPFGALPAIWGSPLLNISAGGSGYVVGEVLNVTGGTGTVTVGSVNLSGGVTSLSAGTAGGGYVPSNPYVAQATTITAQPYAGQGTTKTNRIAVTTLAGSAGVTGQANGAGSAALFNYPTGLTTDGTNLYVTDTYNHVIRQVSLTFPYTVTTLAGTPRSPGSTDTAAGAPLFYNPTGIATDGVNLYVADTFNHTIRMVVITTGAVTTLAGKPQYPGFADGAGLTAALFSFPQFITTDGTNLYVTDLGNSAVRRITGMNGHGCALTFSTGAGTVIPAGAGAVTIAAPGGGVCGRRRARRGQFPRFGRRCGGGTVAVATVNGTGGVTGLSVTTGGVWTTGTTYTAQAATINTIATTVTTVAGGVTTISGGTFNNPAGVTTTGLNLYLTDTGDSVVDKIH